MSNRNVREYDPLEDFTSRELTLNDIAKTVYTSGTGPAVIVMPEMPGISPHVARFARWVRDAGFTVYMPSLFGKDGTIPSADEGAEVFKRACVSVEFHTLANSGASPVTAWLRALSQYAHKESGGRGVGAIGMCFTGNFALSMMLEPSMLAPVLSQPTLPLNDPGGIESSEQELQTIRKRMEKDNLKALAYRFQGDKFCRAQRFAAYEEALGDRIIIKSLPDESANIDPPPFFKKYVPNPHSVVTAHLVDEKGHPTIEARDEILTFFKKSLS